MSKHQDIIDNLVARLGAITTAGGYSVTLTDRVHEWQVKRAIETLDDSELPIVDVRDSDPVKVSWSGFFEYDLPVEIDAWFGGKLSKAKARQIVYDVFAALNTDRTLSGAADEIFPDEYTVRVELGEKLLANVNIKLRVRFATEPWESD